MILEFWILLLFEYYHDDLREEERGTEEEGSNEENGTETTRALTARTHDTRMNE
jgi:hypothetical protein